MKKVVSKPRNKNFLDFMKEELEKESNNKSWIYIDEATINYLKDICGISYMDNDSKLHIPYGNIIVDGYGNDYAWHRIVSINSEALCFNAVADPVDIIFITIEV